MIPSEKCDALRILDLVGEKQGDRLDRVMSSVHEVSHEEVPHVWDLSRHSEEL